MVELDTVRWLEFGTNRTTYEIRNCVCPLVRMQSTGSQPPAWFLPPNSVHREFWSLRSGPAPVKLSDWLHIEASDRLTGLIVVLAPLSVDAMSNSTRTQLDACKEKTRIISMAFNCLALRGQMHLRRIGFFSCEIFWIFGSHIVQQTEKLFRFNGINLWPANKMNNIQFDATSQCPIDVLTSNVGTVAPKYSSASAVVSSFWPKVCAAAEFSSIPLASASFKPKSFTLEFN